MNALTALTESQCHDLDRRLKKIDESQAGTTSPLSIDRPVPEFCRTAPTQTGHGVVSSATQAPLPAQGDAEAQASAPHHAGWAPLRTVGNQLEKVLATMFEREPDLTPAKGTGS